MPDFVFLGDGSSEADEEARKRIRSAATRFSHHHGDRKPKSKTGEGVKGKDVRRRRRKRPGIEPLSRIASSAEGLLTTWELPSRSVSADSLQTLSSSRTDGDGEASDDSDALGQMLYVRTPSPIRTSVATEIDNPFETYPVTAQPWFSRLLFHLNSFMLRGWASLPMSDDERQSGIIFVQRQTREDPSYFYMNLLSIAGDLNDKNQVGASLVPWLTAKVVASVNSAVGDPKRALTAATIMTVGRIMLHETFLGDADVGQNIHRRAFAKMVVMAGGVDALDLPEVVRCSWAWTERLLARKTGVPIGQMEPSLLKDRTFQRGREFKEDVKVLEGYHEKREWKREEFGEEEKR